MRADESPTSRPTSETDRSVTATAVMPRGTLARVIVPAIADNAVVGTEVVIEDFCSAEESEDGKAFYWASRPGNLNDVWVQADCVEQVKSVEEMAARRPPSCEDVARGLRLLTDHRGVFEADESAPDGAAVDLYGMTPDGLRIGVRLRVESVEEVDF